MQKTKNDPQKFLASFENSVSEQLTILDKLIMDNAPKSIERVMWEGVFWGGSEQKIIGYGEFSYINSKKEKVDWFVIGLAKQKNYITVYINGYEDGVGLAKKYSDNLGKVKTSTSAINIKDISDVNIDELGMLIKKAFELSNE